MLCLREDASSVDVEQQADQVSTSLKVPVHDDVQNNRTRAGMDYALNVLNRLQK